jgi:hypothetical protein
MLNFEKTDLNIECSFCNYIVKFNTNVCTKCNCISNKIEIKFFYSFDEISIANLFFNNIFYNILITPNSIHFMNRKELLFLIENINSTDYLSKINNKKSEDVIKYFIKLSNII